ncbi:acyl-CoA dehydratase activase [Syntrophomonas wolfei]|uniref:CoA-substrate-specific enzyme activase domain protein n=1 Tax=Syntrophomonas wolfei subsp. wolfei (strain DSM 2245B / Goettingen) TaxID=335541 RepID=Q0AZ94_SYNWW|nr:acyl-CoA dehydratase activase [Syntrophomonas wolfei]ABI67960.1 CoA-substrate-specific enzyme activase domain protein [Syntrophomonas wolfei subsp. wolfei str. Goettingen G311]
MNLYLGVDIGSVSSNFILLDQNGRLYRKLYLRTLGNPVKALKDGYASISDGLDKQHGKIRAVGSTGSGRHLAAVLLGADVVKNEITAHAVAASHLFPGAKTIIEIGGQDSKIIILRNGIVHDFAMNTVCAAGTGSFLDQQSARLNIPIQEFGDYAVKSGHPVRIAGRCGVFAESDMIHKQQMGFPVEDIIMGLCEALVRNYLNNVGKGKKIEEPVVFQGGVAANRGLAKAFEKILGLKINVPAHYEVMGAIGAAILAREQIELSHSPTRFRGDNFVLEGNFTSNSHECSGCPNLCEVVCIKRDNEVLAYWGDRCKKWESSIKQPREKLKVV